ncbi:hypothetical protein BOTCAL_0057g00270 [Botryotinia calthae]|uniref:Uncharacterized protein n=1 Tax=Botryotinia calthae TaxID=38488 RepID=A0A4Y8DAP9_9HELO|nr:hypothetical protein BOTCAL_0057g00270 [Botryotinia calthae]
MISLIFYYSVYNSTFESVHLNHQFLFKHVSLCFGVALGVGFTSGEGSTQTKPNQFLEVHVWVVVDGVEVEGEGRGGAEVMEWDEPSVLETETDVEVEVGSLQPNQPGCSQVVVAVVLVAEEVEVGVFSTEVLLLLLLLSVAVFSSLQPNQPGVLQVEVDVDVVVTGTLVVGMKVVDVSSSRHPHHPGVLHVEVRLRVFVVEVDVDGGEVAVLLLLPSTSFQSGQSTHSGL